MASFADLQAQMDSPRRLVSLQKYVNGLKGMKRFRMAQMIGLAMATIEEVYLASHPQDDRPEFLICLGTDDSPEGAFNRIHLSEGYLEHCLGATFAPIEGIVDVRCDLNWWRYEYVGALGLLWTLAHEYAHLYRPHRVFNGPDASLEPEVRLATERDADLCAISVVFLALRRSNVAGASDADTLRQLTLYAIFWILRPWRDRQSGATLPSHLPMGVRLLDFARKLAIMNDDPTIPSDQSAQFPISRERFEMLRACLFRCEDHYLMLNPGQQSIHVDLQHDLTTRASDEVVKTWDTIRYAVDEAGKM